MKIKTSIALLVFFLGAGNIYAQHNKLFVGFQPAVTKEKFYNDNEFDVNVFPLVLQKNLGANMDVRVVTLANYFIADSNSGFSDLGLNSIWPYYFLATDSEILHGPYVGPLLGFGRNVKNDHNTVILGAETGYMFKTSPGKRFTLSIGLQYGRTYFDYDNGDKIWREHFGLGKINLGWWIDL